MNLELRVVIRQIGLVVLVLSATIAAVGVFAVFDSLATRPGDRAHVAALWVTAMIGSVGGAFLHMCGRPMSEVFGHREALLLVALSWVLGAALSALPFRLWALSRADAATTPHVFDSYVDCYFEAMSGLTTTGATVVEKVRMLPRGLLLWRSLTQWLGGLGIVVLFVAVLPILGVGSRRLYRVEVPGPSPEGVKPRIRDTARALWLIYVGFTAAGVVALMLSGMSWFDSVCHMFTTMATGGFSTHEASVAAYPSVATHVVIIGFMILAGINFGLYHQVWQRRWSAFVKDPELHLYLTIIVVATGIVALSLLANSTAIGVQSEPIGFAAAFLHALFQVVSIQTTTGFCSADFDTWGFAAKGTLVALMFIGACAGSTGGGVKVVRVMITAKVLLNEMEQEYRPKVVRPLKIGKNLIDPALKLSALVYVLSLATVYAIGTVALMLLDAHNGIDITTAASAAAATLNNVGPGLGKVGATQTYAWFTASSKLVMSILMLLGRLELFVILVLLSPRFWRTE